MSAEGDKNPILHSKKFAKFTPVICRAIKIEPCQIQDDWKVYVDYSLVL